MYFRTRTYFSITLYNPDTRDPDIRVIFSGPKFEPMLPKQNRPNLDIRDFFSGPKNSLISRLHCICFCLKFYHTMCKSTCNTVSASAANQG